MVEQIIFMAENGAVPFWLAIAGGMVFIGGLVWSLESDNKVAKRIRKFLNNNFDLNV